MGETIIAKPADVRAHSNMPDYAAARAGFDWAAERALLSPLGEGRISIAHETVDRHVAEGNGDPSLCIFGERVTPNQHALAREFVLLDNTYCAGILSDESLGDLDFDRIRTQFEVNSLGPLRVTAALRGNLGQGSKVAIITSRMGSIGDNDSGGRYGYRASKAAFNAFGRSLAIDLKGRGIAVAQLHPGFVKTRMVNFGGLLTTEESVAGLVERIENLNLENTGSFWHCNGEELPW